MFFIGYSRDINNIVSDFFFVCIEGVKDKIIKYYLDNCYYENV